MSSPTAYNRLQKFIADLIIKNHWSTGAELGVSKGKMTGYLVNHTPVMMIAVDLWDDGSDDPRYEGMKHDRSYKIFQKHIEPVKEKVQIFRMLSWKAAELVEDKSLDFVFIDADHTYEGVKRDILAWRPKVKHLTMGHDYNLEGVQKAVEELLGPTLAGPDNAWLHYEKD